MATNAMKYYASYMQSHQQRFEKFRDEAYQELLLLQKNDLAYRKLLQQREKALVDGIARLKAAKPTGDAKTDFEALSLILRANDQIIGANEDAAKRGIEIEARLRNALTPPKQSNDQIAEMERSLSTAALTTGSLDVINATVNSGIDNVVATVAPGSTQAAAAAQNTLKALESQQAYQALSPADKDAIKQRLTTRFGLDTVNISGVSGRQLLEVAQDALVDRELDRQLQEYGGAYGVRTAREVIDKVNAAMEAAKSGKPDEAAQAIQDAKDALVKKAKEELPKIQAELKKVPEVDLSEARVRELARQKYGPEAATFMKKQFERDSLGGDTTSLLHYDALQAAKAGTIKPSDDAKKAAAQLMAMPPALNKKDERERALAAANQFADKDVNLRDQFLVAYHQQRLDDMRAKFGPSEILPEPLVEPKRMGNIDELTAGSLSGVDMEARKQEVLKDATTRDRITNRIVELTKEQMAVEQRLREAQEPGDAERLRQIREDKDFLISAYKDPKYSPEEFTPELAGVYDTMAATAREPGVIPAPRRIGNLPSVTDLFMNEAEALLPRQPQKKR